MHQGHPWNLLENDEFLMKLRAAAKNDNGELAATIAGLLFFGEAYRITEVFPNYFLDYREESEDKSVRWLFRTHSDEGDWSGNLYDFYYKVINRIDDDIAVVGSYNFDCRSTYVDTETMLVVQGKEITKQLEEDFSRLKSGSLKVNQDGSYQNDKDVAERTMDSKKQGMIKILSYIIQAFRYLA